MADTDKMVRTAAQRLLDLMKKRIHQDGLDASDKRIGTYSKGYMVIRTGSFKNAPRISRGKNKGNIKNAGVFTDKVIRLNKQTGVFSGDEKEGKPRPNYHRTNDTKVILSLTRQMENDMKVVPVKSGSYAIGFSIRLTTKRASRWKQSINSKKKFTPFHQLS